MSFILDALKKSEHKRRAEAGGNSVELDEVRENTTVKHRQSAQLLLIFLLLGVCLLLGVLVWQRPWSVPEHLESPVTTATEQTVIVPVARRPADISARVTHQQEGGMPLSPPEEERPRDVASVPAPLPAVKLPGSVSMTESPAGPDVAVDTLVYRISDLPADVRRRLPALQMALHAYNASDAAASLVQINGNLVREGAQIAEQLTVDEITSEGAILRSDSYRFLLPRRSQ